LNNTNQNQFWRIKVVLQAKNKTSVIIALPAIRSRRTESLNSNFE
jgi:hypothetical protein